MAADEGRQPDKVEQYKARLRHLTEVRDRIVGLLGQLDGFWRVIDDMKNWREMSAKLHGSFHWAHWPDNTLSALNTFRNAILEHGACRQEVGRLWNSMSRDEQWELKPPSAFDRERP